MAVDKKISQLTSLAQVNVDAAADVLPIVDTSATETKKITVSALVGAGAAAGLTGVDINSGTIDGTTIGASSASTGAFTTLSASSTATFNQANASTSLAPTGTGTVTINPATAGTINNMAIGGTTAAAGTFTTVTGTSVVNALGAVATPSYTFTGDLNTGMWSPTADTVAWSTGGSERMRLDTSGNLGIGNTPAGKLDVGATSSAFTDSIIRASTTGISELRFADTTINAGYVAYDHTGDSMRFGTATTERLRIDSSGNVGIGGTSPAATLSLSKVTTELSGTGNSYGIYAYPQSSGQANIDVLTASSSNTSLSLRTYNNGTYTEVIKNLSGNATTFQTAGTTRLTIDASGNVGIGGTAGADTKVNALGTYPTSGTVTRVFFANGTIPSGTTAEANGFQTSLNTQAAAFTLGSLYHFQANGGTFGASSAVTNQYGFAVASSLTGATNNYGFYSNIASGSNRWNFYAGGTAQNYFAGVTTIGTTSTNLCAGNVAGIGFGTTADGTAATGGAQFSIAGNPGVNVNRKTDDGALVGFYQDGTLEGTISVAGNTISYNAFAGSHWSQLQDGSKPDILRGTVMESINELCVWPGENNERLPKSKISDTAGSKKVYGVFMAWDNDWTATNDMLITSVGAFICRVNSAVTVQEGDLLESNGDGTARVQADDIIRSSTIGKVTSTVKTHQYNDGSYCVPTVLYCG